MYIKINNKNIEIIECNTFKERFKSLKFILEPITYGIKIPNKRLISTYFFCQKVDIMVTDHDNKIIKLYENMKSEKKIFLLKKYNIYYLPLNTVKYLKLNDIINEKK